MQPKDATSQPCLVPQRRNGASPCSVHRGCTENCLTGVMLKSPAGRWQPCAAWSSGTQLEGQRPWACEKQPLRRQPSLACLARSEINYTNGSATMMKLGEPCRSRHTDWRTTPKPFPIVPNDRQCSACYERDNALVSLPLCHGPPWRESKPTSALKHERSCPPNWGSRPDRLHHWQRSQAPRAHTTRTLFFSGLQIVPSVVLSIARAVNSNARNLVSSCLCGQQIRPRVSADHG